MLALDISSVLDSGFECLAKRQDGFVCLSGY